MTNAAAGRALLIVAVCVAAVVVRWVVVVSSSSSDDLRPYFFGAAGGGGRRSGGTTTKKKKIGAPRAETSWGAKAALKKKVPFFAVPTNAAEADAGAVIGPAVPPSNITVLCHMSGEMGNHLDIYAHCHALRRILEERYYYSFHGGGDDGDDADYDDGGDDDYDDDYDDDSANRRHVMKHQHHGVQMVVRYGYRDDAIPALRQCFPHFRSVDFDEGARPMYDQALRRQEKWLQRHPDGAAEQQGSGDNSNDNDNDDDDDDDGDSTKSLGNYELVRGPFSTMSIRYEPDVVVEELDRFVNRLLRVAASERNETRTHARTQTGGAVNATSDDIININPMSVLYVRWLFTVDAFVDGYIDEIRTLYNFLDNSTDCCLNVPDPDETVFHLRNFLVEMPNVGKELGFQELSPEQTARDLFGHLAPGDGVAIVSRFGIEYVQPYIDALEARGLRARLVEAQSGVQDFCFLMRAQKGMVGMAISTYFMWAALLGSCHNVTAYSVDTDARRNMFGDGHVSYNYTHPLLKGRFSFPLIAPDDDEDEEAAEEGV